MTAIDDPAARFINDVLPLVDQLYRGALRYTRTTADAEDLVQQTSARTADRCRGRAWLCGVVRPMGSAVRRSGP
jgi:DNA-directed RNA polymerase specialized sigma24 family protein